MMPGFSADLLSQGPFALRKAYFYRFEYSFQASETHYLNSQIQKFASQSWPDSSFALNCPVWVKTSWCCLLCTASGCGCPCPASCCSAGSGQKKSRPVASTRSQTMKDSTVSETLAKRQGFTRAGLVNGTVELGPLAGLPYSFDFANDLLLKARASCGLKYFATTFWMEIYAVECSWFWGLVNFVQRWSSEVLSCWQTMAAVTFPAVQLGF